MKFWDVGVMLLVLTLGIMGIVWSLGGEEGDSIVINAPDGVYRYKLSQNKTVKLRGLSGDFVIEIASGKVRVIETHCPRQLTKARGWVYRTGDSIISLPNQISIKIVGKEQEVDGITE